MTYLDDEVARIREDQTGEYSHEDVQAADSWRLTWERRWEAQVREIATQRTRDLGHKQDRLYEQVRANQRQADDNLRALEAGEISVLEFINRSARLSAQAAEFDRRLDGLMSAEGLIADMLGDPVGWKDSFFEKWTVLQRSRPSIDTHIHEERIKRRNRTRERAQK